MQRVRVTRSAWEEASMSLRHRSAEAADRLPFGYRLHFVTPMRLSVAAIATVAALALAVLLWPISDGPPVASESADPTASVAQSAAASASPQPTPSASPTMTASPTPAPTPRAQWNVLTWSDPVTPPFVVHLADLVPWDDGYVAVGSVEVSADRADAAFLTSPDGLHWTITHQVRPGSDRLPAHLVAVGDELLAFSTVTADGTVPLIWSSPDGTSWLLDDDPSWEAAWTGLDLGPMPATWDVTQHAPVTGLVDVASGPEGLVVIGNAYRDGGMAPLLLHSADALAWSSVSLPADSPSAMLNSVVVRNGGFVMVGANGVGPETQTAEPAAWASHDGVRWTRATVDAANLAQPGIGGELGPILAGEDGLVACRGNREMSAGGPRYFLPFISADGSRWEAADDPNGSPACGWAASDGVRIVALGPGLAPIPWPGLSMAWVSTDGSTWQPMGLSSTLPDLLERFWVVPDGVIYAGVQSFWFGTPGAGL